MRVWGPVLLTLLTSLLVSTTAFAQSNVCTNEEALQAYAHSDMAGRLVADLRRIDTQVQCVREAATLELGLNSAMGNDQIKVACADWMDCVDEDGKPTGKKSCQMEEFDILYEVTPDVPDCVRRVSSVKVYRRSTERTGNDATADEIVGAHHTTGQIIYSSEFFPRDARQEGRYDPMDEASRAEFAANAEERFKWFVALHSCALDLDHPSVGQYQGGTPEPVAGAFDAMSRGRIANHEFYHGVLDALDDHSVIDRFDAANANGPNDKLNKTWAQLIGDKTLTPVEAARMRAAAEAAQGYLRSEREQRYAAREAGASLSRDQTRVMNETSTLARTPVTTPAIASRIFANERRWRQFAMAAAMESGDINAWKAARAPYCAAAQNDQKLSKDLGFVARHLGDVHAKQNAEERFIIALTTAVYEPEKFANHYTPAEQQVIRNWWRDNLQNRPEGCTLEQAQDFARRNQARIRERAASVASKK